MPLMQLRRTQNDYGFTATDSGGNNLSIDIPAEQGGNGQGFRPMQLLLAGLGGCSAVDIVSILKKQKQQIKDFSIDIDGERQKARAFPLGRSTDHLSAVRRCHPAKAHRAVELSMNKFCSVAATLRLAGATLQWKVVVNGTEVEL